jgi:hypothetical protein
VSVTSGNCVGNRVRLRNPAPHDVVRPTPVGRATSRHVAETA